MASLQTLPPPAPAPLPPQPPPPCAPLLPACTGVKRSVSPDDSVCQMIHHQTTHTDLASKAYSIVLRFYLPQSEDLSDDQSSLSRAYISVYRPCTPLIQNGPRCGLIALAMAVEILGHQVSPDVIYQRAKTLGFTKQGEMFSVSEMMRLCEDITQCFPRMVHPADDSMSIIQALLCGYPVLVPYDADRNHQPCLKRGHKAHWVVLSGLLMEISRDTIGKLRQLEDSCIKECSSVRDLYIAESLTSEGRDLIGLSASALSTEELWVYGYQGKSRHPGIWLLSDLIRSNDNLIELDPDKCENREDWVIPGGGVTKGLKNQAVVLESR